MAALFSSSASPQVSCQNPVSMKQLETEYQHLVSAGDLSDFYIGKVNDIELSFKTANSGQDYDSTQGTGSQIKIYSNMLHISKTLTPSAAVSFKVGSTGLAANQGSIFGVALKKGLFLDENGYYILVGRVGLDSLSEKINNFYVTDGFKIENVSLNAGTLQLTLSKKFGGFTPFLTGQAFFCSFSYSGGRSGKTEKVVFSGGLGSEYNFKLGKVPLGIMLMIGPGSSFGLTVKGPWE